MNAKTRAVYEYIRARIETDGCPPTQREIVAACHINSGNVPYHLELLAAHELIEYQPGRVRGIGLKQAAPEG
jgi:SOS-response transcriptional repressor LexA